MKARYENKTTGLLTTVDFKKASVKIFYGVMVLCLLIMTAVCVFPVVWVIISAFKDVDEFYSIPVTIIPHSFHPEKLIEVFKSLNFGKYYANTIILALGELAFDIVFNGLAGYVLARVKPKGHKFVFMLIFWSMMIPTTMNLIPLYMNFVNLPILHISLVNTYWPLWIMAGARCFNILLFRSFFMGLPKEYDEAAMLDGCNKLQILFRILLPLCSPIFVTVAIFSINGSLGQFFWPFLVIKKQEMYPISVSLYQLNLSGCPEDKYMVALFLAMIPSLLVYGVFSKRILGGISLGGVKG